MKHAKKLLAVLLVVLMITALAASASAASITISNPIAGQTYYAYKIFDAEEQTDPVSGNPNGVWKYTIRDDSIWFDTVCDGTQSLIAGLEITDSGETDGSVKIYNVVRPEGSTFSAPAFAELLQNANIATTTNADGNDGGTGTIDLTASGTGYYLVLGNDGTDFEAVAELTTAQDITIQDKNDNVFEKEADAVNVELGQTVTFTLTGKVPDNIADFNNPTNVNKTFTYYVTDTMSQGLTFDPTSLEVTIAGVAVPLTTITDASRQMKDADLYRVGMNGFTFELCLDMLDDTGAPIYNAGDAIVITYTAVVNEDAVTKLTENEATLTYSNDPQDATSFGQQSPDVQLYSSRILIDKYETGQESHKLENAKFVLMNETKDKYYQAVYKTLTDVTGLTENTDYIVEGGVNYAIDASGNKIQIDVEWVDSIDDATVFVTDANGYAEINGLKDGTYYLKETEAPSGYTLLAEEVEVVIDGSAATTIGYDDAQIVTALTNTASIANTPGSLLPSTGGIGTTIFYVVGGLLVLVALVVLLSRKRVNADS